jgi:putative nucleotidyltransferase with HDIG domain
VDDERFIRDILADFLAMEGYTVRTAEDGREAIGELGRATYDVVLSDLKMPKVGGLQLLEHIQQAHPRTLTVIMTGFGTVETAIEAMKRGAYDYVLKPFKADEIVKVVQRAVAQRRLEAENLRLREAVSLYKVSEAISASLSMDQVVETLCTATLRDAHADWVTVWLDDGDGHYVERLSEGADGVSFDGQINSASVEARLATSPAILEHGAHALPFVSGSTAKLRSLAAVPLRVRDQLLGWVCAVSLTRGKEFDEGQRKMLSIITSRAAAAIDNARLYENLQVTFQQTIESLARTIDKMDRYTAGHSERVARYAQRLARSLGMNAAEIEIVRQAALMHDIGKIGCVMNLNKPGKLTREEYDAFKSHPGFGKDILDPIQFLEPVIPGVHLHHERWDGRGYPLGLEGANIPIIARLISVADTYDAMTSNRAYRRALPHEVTVDEVARCAKSQFDPDIVGVFQEGIDDWLEEWRELGLDVPE